MFRQMWKLDKEGNLKSIRQNLHYCRYCGEVKQVVDTLLTERASFFQIFLHHETLVSVVIALILTFAVLCFLPGPNLLPGPWTTVAFEVVMAVLFGGIIGRSLILLARKV